MHCWHRMQFGGFNLLLPTVTRLKALYLKARTCSNLGDYCASGPDSVSYSSKLLPLIGLPNCNYQFGVKRKIDPSVWKVSRPSNKITAVKATFAHSQRSNFYVSLS